jgi:aminopeptidase N
MIKISALFVIGAIIYSCGTKPPPAVEIKPEVEEKVEYVPEKKNYRNSYTRRFNLIHTRLNIIPDWKKKEISGDVAIILRPHFYASDSITLNARGMQLREVSLLASNGKHLPLKFEYDSLLLNIKLDRVYSREESFTLFISYIARPDNLPDNGSAAIQSDKGFYIINADSINPEKPTQFWTQGETESNSAWFPTIEDPAQKMTQEIYITVDSSLTTLSNGLFISSVNNNDGTKTDYWKQSLPAAPYLTMVAAGNFAVVKQQWKNIEVSYYVDPPYEKYALMTYGNTPEMLTFFSDLLAVPYVWEKYSQVVVHDYISGAMENATAVIHGTNMQQDPREIIDGDFEDYISHELFHHWFGNLVTAESWSNITLNEGFANYSEYLWKEYKYGRDIADLHNQSDLSIYLFSATYDDPPLIRNEFENREDVYDAISYHKGGRVLHMLRNIVGDTAFFKSLQYYLSKHIFSSAEAADLRLAFEKITGEDLNWFFDQWYFQGGHPKISIDYSWNDSLKQETVIIRQKQDFKKNPLYRIPLDIDIYYNGKIEKRKIELEDPEHTFVFDLPVKPNLVNVDANKTLLCQKTDNKSNSDLIFQYENAPLYLDRFEAVAAIGKSYSVNTPEATMMMRALKDKNYNIRLTAISNIGELAKNDSGMTKTALGRLAQSDPSSLVREKALYAISKYYAYADFSDVFSEALNDSSYKVVARAFRILSDKDPSKAKEAAIKLESDSGNAVLSALSEYYSTSTEDRIEYYKRALRQSEKSVRYSVLTNFTKYLKNTNNPSLVSSGSDVLYERAGWTTQKNKSSAYKDSLKDLETWAENKISTLENDIENTKDNIAAMQKKSELTEWKTLKNKLHEKLLALGS